MGRIQGARTRWFVQEAVCASLEHKGLVPAGSIQSSAGSRVRGRETERTHKGGIVTLVRIKVGGRNRAAVATVVLASIHVAALVGVATVVPQEAQETVGGALCRRKALIIIIHNCTD